MLSGEREAVFRVVAALEDEVLIEPFEIEPQIPMHAPPFLPVAPRLRAVLDGAPIEPPRLAYVPNIEGTIVEHATPAQIRDCLTAHVCRPVLWRASIDAIATRCPGASFVEIGPRAVLSNLFGRGWSPGARACTDAAENWPEHFATLVHRLRDA